MGKEVQPIPPISLRVGNAECLAAEDGFVLLEVVCTLAIIALLAAIILPNIYTGTSRDRLEAYALQTASILNADRSAAVRRQIEVETEIDAAGRLINSGSSDKRLRLPEDIAVKATLATRCGAKPAGTAIVFFATGVSCGGVITLSHAGTAYQISVNWITGGVEIVPINPL
jgi:general secretion pathway protein H